ncbi:hypothetical protein RHGRI_023820 [Rhododendron griersonianum]|uniref:PB1 domain-containing protein n=1 Tax=Rhododendron griersonianum TaxID=479676 RepID=A0AAV6J515_9ERIC|nr:hypothetical protein RHGRI_023820 [Rhododendron griersonianum]
MIYNYGGKIQPRPHNHQLTYAAGDTKILVVDHSISFSDILTKLASLSNVTPDNVVSFTYQLLREDLDTLVSIINDDDLEHMMTEYDHVCDSVLPKSTWLQILLFFANRMTKSGC